MLCYAMMYVVKYMLELTVLTDDQDGYIVRVQTAKQMLKLSPHSIKHTLKILLLVTKHFFNKHDKMETKYGSLKTVKVSGKQRIISSKKVRHYKSRCRRTYVLLVGINVTYYQKSSRSFIHKRCHVSKFRHIRLLYYSSLSYTSGL